MNKVRQRNSIGSMNLVWVGITARVSLMSRRLAHKRSNRLPATHDVRTGAAARFSLCGMGLSCNERR